MKKRTVIALILLFIMTLLVLTGCSGGYASDSKVIYASIRYFDGDNEMMELKSYDLSNRLLVRLETAYGDIIYVGPNNVRIIEEEADR